MIKLLHTSDWHLGQTFFEFERKGEHLQFLDWLKRQVKENGIDLLLIAGDIFDSPNPSAESQRLYYSFLRDITAQNLKLQIIIIAGNHDSAARLEAPNPLLENMNITVSGGVKRDANGEIDYQHLIVPILKGGYCLAVPYLRQGDYPQADTYAQGVQMMYQKLIEFVPGDCDTVVAMGHLQATGSEISDGDRSERTNIGGLEAVSPDAFSPKIKYTALGHLHRAQRVSGRESVRYAGAPLPMSFAEKNNIQGATMVMISDSVEVERLVFEAPVKLISLPAQAKKLSEVLREIAMLPDGESNESAPFLEVKVLITEPEPTLRFQIESALENKQVRLARLQLVTNGVGVERKIMSYDELKEVDPLDMASDVFKRRYGGESMPDAMKVLLHKVVKEIEV